MKSKISYFNGGYTSSNYSIEEGELRTGGLILVEGEHIDSKNRTHKFDKNRIKKIAEKTNTLFENGGNIPLLQDHIKTVDNTVGSLESPVWVELITDDNLPNKKAKHLIGKLGIFTDDIAIKTESAIEKVSKNIVKTISAGLDVVTDTIREISLTSTPAIAGMSLYKSYDSEANFEDSSALTFDDLDNSNDEMNQIEEMFEDLTEKLWHVTKNIQTASEEILQGNNPYELQMQAIQDFTDRFIELIGMNEEENMQDEYEDPRMQIQGQGQNPNTYYPRNQQRYSSDIPLAAFSMADMEKINVEFGYRQAISSTAKALWNKGKTGKTFGQIGSQLGRTLGNATKGKIASVGRLINNTGNSYRTITKNPNNIKLSQRQMKKATNIIDKSGGRKTLKTGGFIPSTNRSTGKSQIANKNTFVLGTPSIKDNK
jgi:methyl-accepting chemotaxis protein